jgi:hypothetical protein
MRAIGNAIELGFRVIGRMFSPTLRKIESISTKEFQQFYKDLLIARQIDDPVRQVGFIYDLAAAYRVDPTELYLYWRQLETSQKIQ